MAASGCRLAAPEHSLHLADVGSQLRLLLRQPLVQHAEAGLLVFEPVFASLCVGLESREPFIQLGLALSRSVSWSRTVSSAWERRRS